MRCSANTACAPLDPDAVQIERLIQQGEGKRLEFKEAAVWNAYKQQKDGEMYQPVLETVASFMNSEGGTAHHRHRR